VLLWGNGIKKAVRVRVECESGTPQKLKFLPGKLKYRSPSGRAGMRGSMTGGRGCYQGDLSTRTPSARIQPPERRLSP